MLFAPWRNRWWPIALDIGADSVKMLQLGKRGGGLAVCACGRWKFPPGVQHAPQHRNELAVSAVRDMLREKGFRGRKVITALSCRQLGIKNVRMPHLPPNELAEAIVWEASERFSFEVTPDRLKYLRAGEIRQGTETRDEIILLAASQETIETHLSMLNEMGLEVEHIEAEPVALFRVFERFLRRRADKDIVSVLLDMGSEATSIIVARGRQIIFIKSIDIGGRRLTSAVAKQLNLSVEEAVELRGLIMKEDPEDHSPESHGEQDPKDRQASESVAWTIHDALRSEVEALAREIALCLRYCSVTFRGLRRESVTVTGGQAYDSAVVKFLAEQLGIDCVVGQPLRGINVSGVAFSGHRRGMLPEWAVCAGLAMRDIDVRKILKEADHGQR